MKCPYCRQHLLNPRDIGAFSRCAAKHVGPRYRPCEKCGRPPMVHNPHPLNDAYVGHEYV